MKTFLILFALAAAAAAAAIPLEEKHASGVTRRDVVIPSPIYRTGYGLGYGYGYGYPSIYEPYGYLRSSGYPYYYGTHLGLYKREAKPACYYDPKTDKQVCH